MFDKIFEAQQKAEEVKKRLESISISAEVEGGAIKVTALASKTIKSIEISEDFLTENGKEGLEDLLVVAINKALAQAENVSQAEMAAVTQQMLGGMGGLGNIFGKK
ncbi:YbaB/EbfC family nucleoid-associated protein [Pelobium sp.]|nr:YbaB/EbfC family nucleoid-associated protein [Pelobium sp.]MDA9554980.1 YbaB/EbfC family nucleoid-associated protein [Pelobium sp.]